MPFHKEAIYYMQSKFIGMIKINDISRAILSALGHLFIGVFLFISYHFRTGVIRKSQILQYNTNHLHSDCNF